MIICEAGATKADWRLIESGEQLAQLSTAGTNVSTMKMDAVAAVIREAAGQLAAGPVDAIYYYTAGVLTDSILAELDSLFKSCFDAQCVEIQTDLVASARAVCGREPGIAAILGTGSNSCRWDGTQIVSQVRSGGFILGDEGSGARLGKLFLSDYIKGLVPADVAEDFAGSFDASYAAIVEGVYRSASPSGYLGSFAPFLLKHRDDPYVASLIRGNFQDFIVRILKKYDTDAYSVGLVGGFAWACGDILLPLLEQNGIRVSGISKAPVEGLIRYHCFK